MSPVSPRYALDVMLSGTMNGQYFPIALEGERPGSGPLGPTGQRAKVQLLKNTAEAELEPGIVGYI